MNVQNTNDLPDLSPQLSGPPDPIPDNFFKNPGSTPKEPKTEVFVNTNAARIIEEETVTLDQPESADNPVQPLKKVPRIIIFGVLILILLTIVGLTVNEVFFNKITSLSLVPDDAEYYLSLSVKEHPQAKKAEELVKKLPAGDKMLESLDGYTTELLGQKDPFEDILRLAKKDIFLAKLRPEANEEIGFGIGFDKLLNIVELKRPKDARNELEKFSKDPDIYDINEIDHNGQTIFNIKLKEKSSSAQQRLDVGPLPSSVTLPLSQGTFATAVKNFIVAGDKISDVKKSIDLAKVKSIFGFNNSELKSIQDDPGHKEISKNFPDETLVRLYQNQPLTPFGDFLPNQSLGQSFLLGQNVTGSDERSETFIRLPRGFTVTAEDDGMDITSYQMDIKSPDEDLKNSFKMEDSLAGRLPNKFSGISPAFYGETKNYYQIYQDQIEEVKHVAENSDNRTQREGFKEFLVLLEEGKKEFRKSVGIDYEDDLLAYLDSNVASIFNAGSAKKAPEFLIVGEIKDEEKVIKSLSKIKIPDYLKQLETSSQDSTRRSNLYSIGTGLTLYMVDNINPPLKLADLVPDYISKLPKDPETKKSYKYILSTDKKSATVEAKLNDSRTAYYSTKTNNLQYKGVQKKLTFPPITPKKSKYKSFEIYTMNLYSFGDYTLNMYFAAENKKLILLFSDTSESLKDILDFKEGTSETLNSNEIWKTQFEGKGDIGGFAYVEPIQFWGLVEYFSSLYPEYKTYITSDVETAIKGYLKTLKSIGTVVTKEKPVHVSRTFVSVVELPEEEKEKIEDAVQRLLDADKNNGYSTVLGVETSTNSLELWTERFKKQFLPDFLR